jgi:hypothetical protein
MKNLIRVITTLTILVLTGASDTQSVLAAEEETAKQIIAAQIKRQGYACKRPEQATRDEERSKPNEAVWVLRCESGTYRVRLVPDMAAHIERLE